MNSTDTATLCTEHEAGACFDSCPHAYSYDDSDAGVADFAETIGERLRAGTVDRETYLAGWRADLARDMRELNELVADNGIPTSAGVARGRRIAAMQQIVAEIAAGYDLAASQLEAHEDEARTNGLERPADAGPSRTATAYIDAQLDRRGLPNSDCQQDDALPALWMHALLSLEATETETSRITDRAVADRIVAAYAALYGLDS